MLEKVLLPANADNTQQLLRQNGHFSVNMAPHVHGVSSAIPAAEECGLPNTDTICPLS